MQTAAKQNCNVTRIRDDVTALDIEFPKPEEIFGAGITPTPKNLDLEIEIPHMAAVSYVQVSLLFILFWLSKFHWILWTLTFCHLLALKRFEEHRFGKGNLTEWPSLRHERRVKYNTQHIRSVFQGSPGTGNFGIKLEPRHDGTSAVLSPTQVTG